VLQKSEKRVPKRYLEIRNREKTEDFKITQYRVVFFN